MSINPGRFVSRICTMCLQWKAPEEYWSGRRKCKTCTREDNRQRYRDKYAPSECFRASRNAKSREYYAENRDRHNASVNAKYRSQRDAVLAAYGGRCACCGEDAREFLAIDHIDGGGNAHRRSAGIKTLTRWLIKNSFPKGFRVLCHNCNMARGIYGYCPHSREDACAS